MKILPPKYVSRANQWVVTTLTPGKDKVVQTQMWFDTLEKATEFYKERREK